MRDRIRILSLVTPEGTVRPDTAAWQATGDTSVLAVEVGAAGTQVIGASLQAGERRSRRRTSTATSPATACRTAWRRGAGQ